MVSLREIAHNVAEFCKGSDLLDDFEADRLINALESGALKEETGFEPWQLEVLEQEEINRFLEEQNDYLDIDITEWPHLCGHLANECDYNFDDEED